MEFNIDHIEGCTFSAELTIAPPFRNDRYPRLSARRGSSALSSDPGDPCRAMSVRMRARRPCGGPEDFVYVLAVLAEDVDRPVECITVEEIVMRSL